MNGILAAIFVLAIFFLSTAGREFEYQDSLTNRPDVDIIFQGYLDAWEELGSEEGMRKQDSLWNVIQAMELLNDKFYILDKREYEKVIHDGYDIREGTEIYIKR